MLWYKNVLFLFQTFAVDDGWQHSSGLESRMFSCPWQPLERDRSKHCQSGGCWLCACFISCKELSFHTIFWTTKFWITFLFPPLHLSQPLRNWEYYHFKIEQKKLCWNGYLNRNILFSNELQDHFIRMMCLSLSLCLSSLSPSHNKFTILGHYIGKWLQFILYYSHIL